MDGRGASPETKVSGGLFAGEVKVSGPSLPNLLGDDLLGIIRRPGSSDEADLGGPVYNLASGMGEDATNDRINLLAMSMAEELAEDSSGASERSR